MTKKLVKNTKIVKLSRTSGSVQSVLRHAIHDAHRQNWNKVIIIGQGTDNGCWQYSRMSEETALGMMEKVKFNMLMSSSRG